MNSRNLLELNLARRATAIMRYPATQLWAFMLLVFGINVIGIMSFFFYERQQRAAFLETRQSLETKLTLEQESQEQVSADGYNKREPPDIAGRLVLALAPHRLLLYISAVAFNRASRRHRFDRVRAT